MPIPDALSLYNTLTDLIPSRPQKEFLVADNVFIRDRKISYTSVLTIILSLCVQQKNSGITSALEQFMAFARNTELWPQQTNVHGSSFSKAREKLTWEAFEDLHKKFTTLAYSLWDDDPSYTWFGMSVVAVDGSKYTLPSTQELREVFDPHSLLTAIENPAKPYFPQCMVTTVYDVFRRIPVARSIDIVHTSERKQLLNLMDKIPRQSIVITDRGYPSYEVLAAFVQSFSGYFLMRCPGSSTFPAVLDFIQSGKNEAIISINPSRDYLAKVKDDSSAFRENITLKAIRIKTFDGNVSVLLTNLIDSERFATEEIKQLYLKRERIENHYRDEKTFLQIERFHSKSPNGIKQELYAILVMSVIARILIMHCQKQVKDKTIAPQFKHAIQVLAMHGAVLTAQNPQRAYDMFIELLNSIKRVKAYPHRKKRENQPRICKKPPNKWAKYRGKRINCKCKA